MKIKLNIFLWFFSENFLCPHKKLQYFLIKLIIEIIRFFINFFYSLNFHDFFLERKFTHNSWNYYFSFEIHKPFFFHVIEIVTEISMVMATKTCSVASESVYVANRWKMFWPSTSFPGNPLKISNNISKLKHPTHSINAN